MSIEELLKGLQLKPIKDNVPNSKEIWRKIGLGETIEEIVDLSEWIKENPYKDIS